MAETPDSPEKADHALDEELPVGPGASFTFLYYFITAGVVAWLFAARLFGVSLITPLSSEVGLLAGAIGGLLGVTFNRSQTLEVTFDSKKKFRQRLNGVLTGMGYGLAEKAGSLSRYQKPNASRFFAGDIFVQQRETSVVLVSRASNIRVLAKRLAD